MKEYKPLTLPKLSWDSVKVTDKYGKLVAAPLEPGFGTTLGNALRRVLLGAIEGSAVTSVIIKGVNNEFATVPGVAQDVMQLLLNIKRLVIKNETNTPGTMRLQATTAGDITAAAITCDNHLQIVNTDLVLAQLSDGADLDIEFFVESGRGYQAAQWPIGQSLQEDGRIYLDALFSPVVRVTFDVDKTRVGKSIDYDKLTLEITTNGAQTAPEVLNYAASVLRTQLENFIVSEEIPFNDISEQEHEETSQEDFVEDETIAGLPLDLLMKSIDELELSARAHNCLVQANLTRVLDLVNFSEDQGLKIKNFGKKSLDEVKESLRLHGLRFGMNIDEDVVQKALQQRTPKKS